MVLPVVTGVYFLGGKLGLSLAFINSSATAVWPCSGIALAGLLLLGYRIWPAILAGAFLVNFSTTGAILPSLEIAAGNLLEALLGAFWVQRFSGGAHAFDRIETIIKFVFFAALASTAVSATVGVTSLAANGLAAWKDYPAIWLTWWLGNMVSDLIIAPLFLVWGSRPANLHKKRLPEFLLLTAATALITGIVFGRWVPSKYPFIYLTLLPIFWAAFRFTQRGAAATAFIISAVAVWGTLQGFGAFAFDEPNLSLLMLQAFIGVIAVTALTLGSLFNERGRAEHVIRDYAERLKRKNRELNDANKELEHFVAIASHDLQVPLQQISMFAELLELKLPKTSEDHEFLVHIQKAAVRMLRLMRDLLEYSHVKKDQRHFTEVDLKVLLEELVEDLDGHIREKRAKIEMTNLPKVQGNPLHLRQLFQNLISNSLKYCKKNEAPRIEINARFADGFSEIHVRDNGSGFAEDCAEKIFLPFQRLSSEGEGSGMGLAICRKIVEQHKGTITAAGQINQGAVFVVKLPREERG